MLKRQLVIQRRCKSSSFFETPLPAPTPAGVKYVTGPRAGEIVNSGESTYQFYEDTNDPQSPEVSIGMISGRTVERDIATKKQRHLEELIAHEEERRLAYQEDKTARAMKHTKLLSFPMTIIFLVSTFITTRYLVDPQADHKMRKEDRENFEKVATELKTFKVEATLSRIEQIELELKKRGVKIPD